MMHGELAVVTGASGGIGQAVALALAAEGASLLLVGRRRPALTALADQVGVTAGSAAVQVITADLSDEAAVKNLFDGPGREVALLVHCAGAGHRAPIAETSLAAWQQVLADNLLSAFLCSREAAARMRRRGGGRIIFIGSGMARRGRTGWSAYCAAKAGLSVYAEALAEEVRPDGISVQLITPGAVETEFWRGQPHPAHWIAPADVAAAVRYAALVPPGVSVPELRIRAAAAPF